MIKEENLVRPLILLSTLISAATNANEVLIVVAEKPQVGQIVAGTDLQMILSTERPCYIMGINNELPYHGGTPPTYSDCGEC